MEQGIGILEEDAQPRFARDVRGGRSPLGRYLEVGAEREGHLRAGVQRQRKRIGSLYRRCGGRSEGTAEEHLRVKHASVQEGRVNRCLAQEPVADVAVLQFQMRSALRRPTQRDAEQKRGGKPKPCWHTPE